MGEFDRAEEIYTTLIETADDDDREELAFLHPHLGCIKREKGDSALSHYQQSLDMKLIYLSSDDPRLTPINFNIGGVREHQGDLDGVLGEGEFQEEVNSKWLTTRFVLA